ncbi:MAG: DUF86 domain-containing protein [Patescibacteria group bacterium]
MHKPPLSRVKIESKLAIIREAIERLPATVSDCTEEEFAADITKFAVTEHFLRRALEAVFDIAGHIISRFSYSPGKRPKTLKEVAAALGEKGVVDAAFAEGALSNMAGYRNRMVHFYDEITSQELYRIVTRNLGDFETFAAAAVHVIQNPSEFDLAAEE